MQGKDLQRNEWYYLDHEIILEVVNRNFLIGGDLDLVLILICFQEVCDDVCRKENLKENVGVDHILIYDRFIQDEAVLLILLAVPKLNRINSEGSAEQVEVGWKHQTNTRDEAHYEVQDTLVVNDIVLLARFFLVLQNHALHESFHLSRKHYVTHFISILLNFVINNPLELH